MIRRSLHFSSPSVLLLLKAFRTRRRVPGGGSCKTLSSSSSSSSSSSGYDPSDPSTFPPAAPIPGSARDQADPTFIRPDHPSRCTWRPGKSQGSPHSRDIR